MAEESISIQEFWNQLSFMRGHLHKKCVSYMWNLIDSHDTARFLYSCQENKEKLKQATNFINSILEYRKCAEYNEFKNWYRGDIKLKPHNLYR